MITSWNEEITRIKHEEDKVTKFMLILNKQNRHRAKYITPLQQQKSFFCLYSHPVFQQTEKNIHLYENLYFGYQTLMKLKKLFGGGVIYFALFSTSKLFF